MDRFLSFMCQIIIIYRFPVTSGLEYQVFEEARLVNTPLCPDPPPVANSYRWSVEGSVLYACILGCQMTRGNGSLVCLNNGSWSGQSPLCELTCGQPPVAPGANMTGVSMDASGALFAHYNCLPSVNSTYTMTSLVPCMVDSGYWMTPPTNCLYTNGFHVNMSSEIGTQTAHNINFADRSLRLYASSTNIENLDIHCLRLDVAGLNGSTFEEVEVPVKNITQLFEFVSVELSLETIDSDTECVETAQISSNIVFGINYTGVTNMTASGISCQPWRDTTPHNHTYNNPNSTSFPDPSFADVKNYCRNPLKSGLYKERPWCFTSNSSVTWEYCSIRECSRFTVAVKLASDTTAVQTCGQTSFYRSQAASKISIKCPTSPLSPYGTRVRLSVNSTLARSLYVCDALAYGVDYTSKCGEPRYQRGWNLTSSLSYNEGAEAEFACAKGYHYMQGDGQIKCLGNRTWSTPTLVCSGDVNHAYTTRITPALIQDNDVNTCSPLYFGQTVEVRLDYTVEVQKVAVMFIGSRPQNVTVTAYIPGNHTRNCRSVTETTYGFLFTCVAYPITQRIVLTFDSAASLCEVKVFGRLFTGVLECKQTESGVEYKGHLNFSSQGYDCSPWVVINKTEFLDYEFSDGNISDVRNYCRNPVLKSTGQPLSGYRPICYYRIPAKSLTGWDFCNLFSCEKGCRVSKDGHEYTGKIDQSMKNASKAAPCAVWNSGSSLFKLKSDFSESSSPSSKYCRNPGVSQERPWCYTNTTSLTYAYCDIPMCPTAENTTHLSVDLNQTNDHFTLKTYADTFRECLLTDFYQASYAPPIYDAIMTQLCYTNPGKHKDLLCHYKSDTNLNDYGDGALWMRVHIICPSDPLATTPAMTSIASTSVASFISSEATSVAPQSTQTSWFNMASTQTSLTSMSTQSSTQQIVETSTSIDTQSLCPISCHVRCSPNTNISIEIKVYKEQIRQELLVNTNSLSKTIRTKTSAPDPRPTARVTGGVAIAVVVVITVCLLSGDVVTLSCFIYLKFKGNSLLTMQ